MPLLLYLLRELDASCCDLLRPRLPRIPALPHPVSLSPPRLRFPRRAHNTRPCEHPLFGVSWSDRGGAIRRRSAATTASGGSDLRVEEGEKEEAHHADAQRHDRDPPEPLVSPVCPAHRGALLWVRRSLVAVGSQRVLLSLDQLGYDADGHHHPEERSGGRDD